jgi:acetate kinase
MFCYRTRKYIGAYLAPNGWGRCHCFLGRYWGELTGAERRFVRAWSGWGLQIDPAANAGLIGGKEGPIHLLGSRLGAYVIPTDEELLIARNTVRGVHGDNRKKEVSDE